MHDALEQAKKAAVATLADPLPKCKVFTDPLPSGIK